MGKPIDELYWSHVEKTDGCWKWNGTTDNKGYGIVSACNDGHKSQHKAHRVSWTIHHGEIPDGLFVCHACDNPPCTRPDHLWLGTTTDNIRDASKKGRLSSGDRHWTKIRPEGTLKGVEHGMCKLSVDDVHAIRKAGLRARGDAARLAKRFGVTPGNIRHIVARRCWKHV